LISCRNK